MGGFLKFALSVFAFTVVFAQWSSALIKYNDYTKANRSFDSKYRSKSSSLTDKAWSDSSKRSELKTYVPQNSADALAGKRFTDINSGVADQMQSSKNRDSSKAYENPELHGFDKNGMYSDSKWKPKRDARNFSKDYEGSIDFSKRGVYVDYLKEAYADMNERSMQDINKYQFRSSHSSDPGIKTVSAGSGIHGEDDESFFESIFGDDKIERKPIRLFGPKNRNAVSKEDAPAEAPLPIKQPGEVAPPAPTVRYAPPIIKGDSPSAESQHSSETKKRTVAEQEIDQEKIKGFKFMDKVPENMRGKATIKIEVDDGDF